MGDKTPDPTPTIEELLAINEAQKAALAAKEAEAAEKDAVIAALNAVTTDQAEKIAAAPALKALPEVTHDKKKYRFTCAAFMVDNGRGGLQKVTAVEAAKNAKLIADLIGMQSGVLEAV